MLKGEIYGAGSFKCITVDQSTSNLLTSVASRLDESGVESARREATWMLAHVTGRSQVDLMTRPEARVEAAQVQHLQQLVDRRIQREPIQYLLGSADFYGRTFTVTPDVLIPRPETEELVERILALGADVLHKGIVDLGTGSGCIPITIACEQSGVSCTGVDVSTAALDVARANAKTLGADVRWVGADMRDEHLVDRLGQACGVLVSNPPYVPDEEASSLEPEVRDHEPHLALFSGEDPLHFYRAICEQAPRMVLSGGHVLVEIHADAGPDVQRLFQQAGMSEVRLHRDLSDRDRIVHARVP